MASTSNSSDKDGPLYDMKETVTVERGTYAGATAGVTGKIKERIESVGRGWRYVVQTPEGTVINDVAEDDLAPAADP